MLGHEDEGCVLTGNFTLLSTLAAGAAYIECCKGYPIWLPKPAYISTQDAAQTFTFIKSPAGSIPDISERSGCMLMLCFTNCICESFMQEKDKCLWPELSIIMDMLSQLTTFSDTRARWGCRYSHLLPNLSSPKQHTAELTSSLTHPTVHYCTAKRQRFFYTCSLGVFKMTKLPSLFSSSQRIWRAERESNVVPTNHWTP